MVALRMPHQWQAKGSDNPYVRAEAWQVCYPRDAVQLMHAHACDCWNRYAGIAASEHWNRYAGIAASEHVSCACRLVSTTATSLPR